MSHYVQLVLQSQSYNRRWVLHLCLLDQLVGVYHVRLGALTVEVEWIVKGWQGTARLLIEDESSDR